MMTILFACVHNAGRSQMAAAFFNAFADPHRADAISAGTQPADKVHPEVVEVMREVGIDLSQARPRKLTDDLARQVQMLITMGCGESCPVVPGVIRDDWQVPDPRGQSRDQVRKLRDDLSGRIRQLIWINGWGKVSQPLPK